MKHSPRLRNCVFLGMVLLVIGSPVHACETCSSTDRWAEAPPFETSRSLFNEYTMGLEEGTSAPLLQEMGLQDELGILYLIPAHSSEEIASLRLISESVDCPVVVAVPNSNPSAASSIIEFVGEGVVVVTEPLASQIQASYWVGDFVVQGGIIFLLKDGLVVQRRLGSPIWLLQDDLATPRALADGSDLPATPQYILSEGESAPAPEFELLDQTGARLDVEDGRSRLYYTGPFLPHAQGDLVFADLEALRMEFPDVEFVWRWPSKSDEQLAELWKFYNASGLAWMHSEWYELPFEEYMNAVTTSRDDSVVTSMQDIPTGMADGWRHIFDPGNQLGILWGLRFSPHVLILDTDGAAVLPFTTYPLDRSTGEYRVHPDAQEALRTILTGLASG